MKLYCGLVSGPLSRVLSDMLFQYWACFGRGTVVGSGPLWPLFQLPVTAVCVCVYVCVCDWSYNSVAHTIKRSALFCELQ